MAIGSWPAERPFPVLLRDDDLRQVLGVSWSTFYRLKKLGRFRPLIVQPVLTTTIRYSGLLVERWVKGELTQARTFGAKRTA